MVGEPIATKGILKVESPADFVGVGFNPAFERRAAAEINPANALAVHGVGDNHAASLRNVEGNRQAVCRCCEQGSMRSREGVCGKHAEESGDGVSFGAEPSQGPSPRAPSARPLRRLGEEIGAGGVFLLVRA